MKRMCCLGFDQDRTGPAYAVPLLLDNDEAVAGKNNGGVAFDPATAHSAALTDARRIVANRQDCRRRSASASRRQLSGDPHQRPACAWALLLTKLGGSLRFLCQFAAVP